MINKGMVLGEEYIAEEFTWRVRKVANWLGQTEIMIELDELKGCVSFGDTIGEAKAGLAESLFLWIQKHGLTELPDVYPGAHLIILDPPMCEDEFSYINIEVKKLN